MLDDIPDLPGSGPAAAPARRQGEPPDLKGLTLDQLLDLRARIEPLLPARNLQDMDLQRELVLQVLALQQLQQRVLADGEAPANQQAQVANSLSAALTNLVKLQNDVYTSERLKQIEQALEETINGLPKAQAEAFMASYAKNLGLS